MRLRYGTGLGLLLAVLCHCQNSPPPGLNTPTPDLPDRAPNVLLIVADDLGWADLNCYGNPLVRSPHLDELARGGVQFLQAYAAGPAEPAGDVGLQTGFYPARGEPASGARTVANYAAEQGYRTAYVGRWPFVRSLRSAGYATSFGVHAAAPDSYYHPFWKAAPPADLLAASREGDYLPDVLTDRALDYLDRWQDSVWLMTVRYYAPAAPVEGRADRVRAYRQLIDSTHWRRFPTVPYAAMVDVVDENVGRLLDRLEATGQAAHTLVVFTSDNGGLDRALPGRAGRHTPPTDNGLLRGGKGDLFEGGVRVPLLLRYPAFATTRQATATPAHGTDVAATVLDAISDGRPVPQTDGRSLLPVLRGQALPVRPLFWANDGGAAVRYGDHKLLWERGTDSLRYYDLAARPEEDLPLAEPPGEVDLARRLRRWRRAVE